MTTLLVCVMLAGLLLVLSGGNAAAIPRARRERRVRAAALPTVGAAVGAAALALIVSAVPFVALLAGVAGAAVPTLLARRRAAQRRAARMQRWPELLDNLTSAVRAGLALPAALAAMAAGADAQLQRAFAEFADDYRRTGDFQTSLQALAVAGDDPVLDRIVQALAITREVGGNDITAVLRSLTVFVREDLRLRGELAARQSWTVNAARLAVAAPWLVLAMLSTRPHTVAAYRSLEGGFVLAGIAVLSVAAYAIMRRIARLPGAVA